MSDVVQYWTEIKYCTRGNSVSSRYKVALYLVPFHLLLNYILRPAV